MSRQFLEIFIVAAIWISSGSVAADPTAAGQADYQAQARAYLKEGLVAQKEGRHEEAIRRFNLAYSLAPHPAILFNLGQAYRLLGDKATAQSFYRKCFLADGRGRIAREAKVWASLLDKELLAEEAELAEQRREQELARQEESARQREEQRRLDEARAIEEAKLAEQERRAERLRAMLAEKLQNERRALARIAVNTPLRPATTRGVIEDAGAAAGFLMPTALMPPRGALSFHNQDLLIVGASYAPLGAVMLSATVAPAVLDEGFVASTSAKVQVLHRELLRVALHGALLMDRAGEPSWGGVGGVVATFCITARCASHASAYVGLGSALDARTNLLAGSAAVQLWRRAKLLVEVDRGYFSHEDFDPGSGNLLWYGLRLTWTTLSVDLGMVKPLSFDGVPRMERAESALGFPVLSLTYRMRRGS